MKVSSRNSYSAMVKLARRRRAAVNDPDADHQRVPSAVGIRAVHESRLLFRRFRNAESVDVKLFAVTIADRHGIRLLRHAERFC